MKARRLVQDPNTKHQNIVFFGSYGVEGREIEKELTFEMDEDRNFITSIPLNLYIENSPETAIYVHLDTSIDLSGDCYYAEVSWEGYRNNEKIQGLFRSELSPEEKEITCEDIYNEIYNVEKLDVVSNFILKVLIPYEESSGDSGGYTFPITYFEKASKLVYDKEKYYNPVLSQNGAKVYNTAPYAESVLFNYSTKQHGVRDSLIPRLSIIKGELWYAPSYGLPLMEKIKSKGIYDAIVVSYITLHPDITGLRYFSSLLENHAYQYDLTIDTKYGEAITLTSES